jgi:EAL domain-containing protein (putative c-di-GMP-specific phosphodiesterase class I)
VARLGGDEFVLLLSGLDDIGKCQQALDRVLHTIAQPYQLGKERLANLSASIGVTLYPVDGADADTLLRHADQAMYLAKQAGRHRYHLFDPEHDRQAHAHREAVARIEAALNAGEFRLYYQPKVNMRHGVVVGAEALIRWQHPERGLLPPGEFLPIIEDSEFSVELGEWVMEEALRQMAVWRAQGLTLPVSVNISARHLQHPQFSQRLHTLLARHPDTPPGQLELEVLETAALDDIAYVSALMERCRALGVMFALDDFGTGYSSLTYLKRLPANVLKIDQSFVRDMLKDPEDLAIIEGVIGLTQAFRRTAIAEGVETLEHGALLIQLGCDLGQGYGIARPMPAEAVPGWVAGFSAPESWRRAGLHPWSRDDFPLLGASIDHQHWIEELVQCLEQDTSHCPPPLDIHHCRFGRWYHGPGQDRYGHLPAFRVIDASHHQVHELASQLHAAHLAGELARVRTGIPELYALRDQMLAQLDALRGVVAGRPDGQDMGGL